MRLYIFRILIATFLFILFSKEHVNAQSRISRFLKEMEQTKGTITDKETGEPIPYAEAFISGSTVYTVTDTSGYFGIDVPYLPSYLVIAHKDYEPFALVLDKNQNTYNIELTPYVETRQDSITTDKKERKKDVRFFYQQFIGDANRSIFKIRNDEVLSFIKDEYSFRAFSNAPLEILNKQLGYRLRVIIREFEITKLNTLTRDLVPLNSYTGTYTRRISGHYYYIPVTTYNEAKEVKIERNRKDLFYGSHRHFFKALYDGNIMEEGYQLNFYPQEAVRNGIVYRNRSYQYSENKIKEYNINADSLKIIFYSDADGNPISLVKPLETYNKKVSVIYPTTLSIKIRPNGTSPNIPFDIKGPMGEFYFVNSLPDDYLPEEKRQKQ